MTEVRVVRVLTRMNIGGPARHVAILSSKLRARGFDTTLVTGTEAAREGTLDAPGARLVRLTSLQRSLDPLNELRAYRDLSGYMRARKPHIVHTHMAKAGALGRIAAKRARVPVIVHTFHGHVLGGYFSKPAERAFTLAERALARISDALVAVSPLIRDELLDLGVGRPEQWHVVPLGLELDELLTLATDRAKARAALGLPPDGPAIGIVGRLTAIKDHETFLRAAARVARTHPDATFVIAGDGELRLQLKARARELLGDRARFLGWVTDLPTLYGALDVVALTSRNEGTPVALIEASAAGKPVVATRVGGVPDVVVDGRTGILAAPGDDEAVAAGILGALTDGAAAAFGEAGRAWVAPRYSAERLVTDVAGLYADLLARKGVGATSTGI